MELSSSSNGRDTHGRFSTGNSYGQGRPVHANKLEYIAVTESVVTSERWRKIVERAAQDAETGTGREVSSAREFLAKYVLPLPQQLAVFLESNSTAIARNSMSTLTDEQLLFIVTQVPDNDFCDDSVKRDAFSENCIRVNSCERTTVGEGSLALPGVTMIPA